MKPSGRRNKPVGRKSKPSGRKSEPVGRELNFANRNTFFLKITKIRPVIISGSIFWLFAIPM